MYTLSFSADITNASTLLWLPPAIIINCQTTVGQEPDKTAPISTIVSPNMSPSSSLMLLQSTFCLGHEAALKSCSICYIYQVLYLSGHFLPRCLDGEFLWRPRQPAGLFGQMPPHSVETSMSHCEQSLSCCG